MKHYDYERIEEPGGKHHFQVRYLKNGSRIAACFDEDFARLVTVALNQFTADVERKSGRTADPDFAGIVDLPPIKPGGDA